MLFFEYGYYTRNQTESQYKPPETEPTPHHNGGNAKSAGASAVTMKPMPQLPAVGYRKRVLSPMICRLDLIGERSITRAPRRPSRNSLVQTQRMGETSVPRIRTQPTTTSRMRAKRSSRASMRMSSRVRTRSRDPLGTRTWGRRIVVTRRAPAPASACRPSRLVVAACRLPLVRRARNRCTPLDAGMPTTRVRPAAGLPSIADVRGYGQRCPWAVTRGNWAGRPSQRTSTGVLQIATTQ